MPNWKKKLPKGEVRAEFSIIDSGQIVLKLNGAEVIVADSSAELTLVIQALEAMAVKVWG